MSWGLTEGQTVTAAVIRDMLLSYLPQKHRAAFEEAA